MSILKTILRAPFVWRAAARDRRLAPGAHYLSAVAIFREEAPFLDEWLTFHTYVGVDHFYLYNNFSTDDFRGVLQPWLDRGCVTLIDWPVETGQLPAYRRCIREHAMRTRWMAFIDIDEFLFSPENDDVRQVLRDYENSPGVVVYSPYFGAAGHQQRPPRPIAKALTRRASLAKISAKTIANPRWVYSIRNVHLFKYWRGEACDTSGRKVNAAEPALDRLRLNHYWSRSLADLHDKIARGDASTPNKRDPVWHFEFETGLNDEEDRVILPVLERAFVADAHRSV
jgi:hypothetical protein